LVSLDHSLVRTDAESCWATESDNHSFKPLRLGNDPIDGYPVPVRRRVTVRLGESRVVDAPLKGLAARRVAWDDRPTSAVKTREAPPISLGTSRTRCARRPQEARPSEPPPSGCAKCDKIAFARGIAQRTATRCACRPVQGVSSLPHRWRFQRN